MNEPRGWSIDPEVPPESRPETDIGTDASGTVTDSDRDANVDANGETAVKAVVDTDAVLQPGWDSVAGTNGSNCSMPLENPLPGRVDGSRGQPLGV